MTDLAKIKDVTLTVDPDGELLAHRTDCPMVQLHRMQGRYIATLFGMEVPLKPDTKDVRLHECLTKP
jgi:hypothetical protein